MEEDEEEAGRDTQRDAHRDAAGKTFFASKMDRQIEATKKLRVEAWKFVVFGEVGIGEQAEEKRRRRKS